MLIAKYECQKTVAHPHAAVTTAFTFFEAASSGKFTISSVPSSLVYTRGSIFSLILVCAQTLLESDPTHSADSCLMLNILRRLWPMRSFEFPTLSAISRTFNRQSMRTSSCTSLALFFVVAIFETPGHGTTRTRVRSRWNSLTARFILQTYKWNHPPKLCFSNMVKRKLLIRFGWTFESSRLRERTTHWWDFIAILR